MKTLREAFTSLTPEMRELLSFELSLTGLPGERYSCTPNAHGGPAFLLYYSPAYMRHCCARGESEAALRTKREALAALYTLHTVYRAARELWPLDTTAEGEAWNVTILIDSIQKLHSEGVFGVFAGGQILVLKRTSRQDGVVEKVPLLQLPEVLASKQAVVLELWKSEAYPPQLPDALKVSGQPTREQL